ncbi:hypothetical protein ACJX0J_027754, partial [Zea mays]
YVIVDLVIIIPIFARLFKKKQCLIVYHLCSTSYRTSWAGAHLLLAVTPLKPLELEREILTHTTLIPDVPENILSIIKFMGGGG